MNHERAQELLPAYIDGDVEAPAELETHLASCAECRSQLSGYREMLVGLAELQDHGQEPHPAVLTRSLAAIPAPSLTDRLVESAEAHPGAYATAVVGTLAGVVAIAIVRRRRRRALAIALLSG